MNNLLRKNFYLYGKLFFLSTLASALLFTSCKAKPDPRVGTPAPAFQGPRVNGDFFSYKKGGDGTIYFVEFFATWCKPCVRQVDALSAFEQKYKGAKDFKVIHVNVDGVSPAEQLSAVRSFLAEHNLNWNPILDQGSIAEKYRLDSLPTTFVIGNDGNFIFATSGLLHIPHFESLLDYARHPTPQNNQ